MSLKLGETAPDFTAETTEGDIDFYDWAKPTRYKQRQDVMDTIRVFYECLGGQKWYSKMPDEVRHLCGGLRRTLVLKRFPTMAALRRHLDSFEWQTMI